MRWGQPLLHRPSPPQQRSSKRTPWATDFLTFLRFVRIESDPDEGGTGGPIPFTLYDYQAERARSWAAGQHEVILKPRQVGFSWLLAAYVYWTSGYHAASHSALFSAGETEVKKLLKKVSYIHRNLPESVRAKGVVGIETAEFETGSSITGYPATKKAGIGTTLKVAAFDEAAFHIYLEDNMGAVVPALGDFGQLIVQSTADPTLGPSGYFHDFYFMSQDGKTTCAAVFLPADIRPGRDEEWFANERKKFPGDEQRFKAFYPFTEAEAFVGRAGLVFPQFALDLHTRPDDPVPWEECVQRVACYDLGSGGQNDPSALVALGVYRGRDGRRRVHQFGEYYIRDGAPTLSDMAAWFWQWQRRAPFDWIERDPVGATSTVCASLRAEGLPVGDEVIIRDKQERNRIHRLYLEERLLTINARQCPESVREYAGYRHRMVRDPNSGEKYATGTPVDNHADAIDARGQALVRLYIEEMNEVRDQPQVPRGRVRW